MIEAAVAAVDALIPAAINAAIIRERNPPDCFFLVLFAQSRRGFDLDFVFIISNYSSIYVKLK